MVTVRYKKLKSGKFSAYLDVYSNTGQGKGKRNYEFLKIYVTKDYSDASTRVVEVDKDKMKIVNAIRNNREDRMSFSENGYQQPDKINYNLLDYFRDCLAKKYYYRLECLTIHLEKYANEEQIYFQDIDADFLSMFQEFLLNVVSQNTANSYMTTFRQYFNKLIVRGIVKESPFPNFKIVGLAENEITTLTIEEVRTLASCIPKKGNSQIRQAFLFSCFTGLRFSDVKKLNYDEIQDDHIVFRPAKTTRKIVRVPLLEDAMAIINSIPRHPKNIRVFWDLPSSQVVNLYLKFWGYEAEIKKSLHFHAARHTFATIGLTYGIDVYTMQKLLGHSKIEMTQLYAKIVDEKRKSEMLKFPSLLDEKSII
jgi:integrase